MTSSPEHLVYPVGHHAAGKTELCDHLSRVYDFDVVETGAMVRSLYASRDAEFEGLSLGEYVKTIEAKQAGYFDQHLAIRLQASDRENVIVNGMRSQININRLHETYPQSSHTTIWLEAESDLLLERWIKRENREISREKFDELLEKDMNLGLGEIKEHADFVVVNNTSIEALVERVDRIMKGLGVTALL